MENLQQKADFLRQGYTKTLSKLTPDVLPKWGKMNPWQMIEHMSDYVRIANGKTRVETITPEDKLPRMQGFLASEKPFPENTPNVLMPESPVQVRNATMGDAISELQSELDHFFEVHGSEEGRTTPNPFFGDLTFDQQVQLLYKHSTHHLRQFGIDV